MYSNIMRLCGASLILIVATALVIVRMNGSLISLPSFY